MTDRLHAAAQRALESLEDLIRNTTDPGVEALGARWELAHALSAPAARQTGQQPDETADDLCAHCGETRRGHHHAFTSTAEFDATNPRRLDRGEPAPPAAGLDASQPATDPLTPADRQFLRFALAQAAAVMFSEDDFTDEDWAALDRLRAFAGPSPEDQAAETLAAADIEGTDQ
ncbi:hypothetical protein [Streptomyces misionensis]|uniref:hypothetical protein n=1 Tax=Streptomyces misionensis TaxID=67331 RepID=UPI0036CC6530